MVSEAQVMSTSVPFVNVIVPVYNGADTIAACLESLLRQTYPADAYEVIVVENGSTDDTTRVVEQYPVRLFHSEGRGPASARNFGLARSEADIVAFTDADCIADSNWLSELVKPYVDPTIGGVGGAILAYDHPDRTIVEMFSEEHSPLVNFMSGENEFLPHLYTANASYRRSLVNRVCGFNPHLVTAEDVDLAWRLQLQTGAKLHHAPQAVIYHRHRSTRTGLSRQYRQYGFGEVLLDTMYGQCPGYPRSRRYQVRRILSQMAALPRYALSAVLRQDRLATGRATPYQAAVPTLWFLIESSNILGKLEGLVATRFMSDAQPVLNIEAEVLISRFFPNPGQL
jgi:glycosyltransferase involved in cell wall biosynthesis